MARLPKIEPQRGRRVLDEGERTARISVMLTADEVDQMDDWMHKHRLLTRSETIRTLMRLGYAAMGDTDRDRHKKAKIRQPAPA